MLISMVDDIIVGSAVLWFVLILQEAVRACFQLSRPIFYVYLNQAPYTTPQS